MLIYNAKIVTPGEKIIENGYVNIENGVITDVGEGKTEGDYDAGGRFAVPGFTDAHTHLGMNVYEGKNKIDFSDRYFDLAEKSGVCAVGISPVSREVIGGEVFAVSTVTKKIIKKSAFKLSAGENPRKYTGLANREIHKIIREFKSDLPLHIHAHAKSDIDALPENAILVHGTEGYGHKKIMAGPMLTDISKSEMEALSYENLYKQYKSGAEIAIISDHPETPVNYLLLYAQLAAKYGVSFDDALKMITVNAAEMLGIEESYGKIKPGYKSGVLIFDRHPIDFYSKMISSFLRI